MDTNHLNSQIIVLANSKAWSSTIKRNFEDTKQDWVLDVEGLEKEILKGESIAAIIEIPQNDSTEFFVRISRVSNNSHGVKLFGVGDHRLVGLEEILNASGFAQWYYSPLEVPRLTQAISQHRQTSPKRKQSPESSIESNLPWPSAAFGRPA